MTGPRSPARDRQFQTRLTRYKGAAMTRDMARTGTTTLTIKTDSRLIEDHLVISSEGK